MTDYKVTVVDLTKGGKKTHHLRDIAEVQFFGGGVQFYVNDTYETTDGSTMSKKVLLVAFGHYITVTEHDSEFQEE